MLALLFALSAQADPTPVKACTDPPIALPASIDEAKRRTVRIETQLGVGSGFFVSPDGFVLTAAHVVGDADQVTVSAEDGSSVEGAVVRFHGPADLALVKIARTDAPCVSLAPGRLPSGQEVYLIGSPGGAALTHSVSKGIVSGWRDVDGWSVLQTDASVNKGNSGGAVLDTSGRAQGVVSFKAVGLGVEGLGFAMGAESVSKALEVSFADATAETIDVRREGKAGASTAIAAPEVRDRPAAPTAIAAKNACKKAKATIEDDPFEGGTTLTAEKGGHYTLRWTAGGTPLATFAVPVSMDAFSRSAGFQTPGAVHADLLLEDGTKIAMQSQGAAIVPGFFVPMMRVDFHLDDAVVLAMASSPLTLIRWQIGDAPHSHNEKTKGDGKAFLGAFACLAVEMGLAGE